MSQTSEFYPTPRGIMCRRKGDLCTAMDIMLSIFRRLLPSSKGPLRFGDFGTGEGDWATVISLQFPHAQVVAIDHDLSRFGKKHSPLSNLQARQGDLTKPETYQGLTLHGANLGLVVSYFDDETVLTMLQRISATLVQGGIFFLYMLHPVHEAILTGRNVHLPRDLTERRPELASATDSQEYCRGADVIPRLLYRAGLAIPEVIDFVEPGDKDGFYLLGHDTAGKPVAIPSYRLFVCLKTI